MSRDENERVPPPGLMERMVQIQRALNEEMSALTPQQRAERAKENLRYMPGQAYLFGEADDG